MKLETYLRTEFSKYIRPIFIKEYCEVCDNTKNLELHHIKQFSQSLNETLEQLEYEYLNDITKYTEKELKLISSIMLSKQLKEKYKTLCSKCHKETYKDNRQYSKGSEIFGIDRKIIFNPYVYKELSKIKRAYKKGLINLTELQYLSRDVFDESLHSELDKKGWY